MGGEGERGLRCLSNSNSSSTRPMPDSGHDGCQLRNYFISIATHRQAFAPPPSTLTMLPILLVLSTTF